MPALFDLFDKRRKGLRRKTIQVLIIGLAVGLVYSGYLTIQNRRAETYYENLRQSDPVRYLDDLRKNEGFDSYLDKFRLLEGYDKYQVDVPPFLVGRWTMKSAPERIAPRTTIAECSESITFEKGLVELSVDGKKTEYPVEYKIVGSDIWLLGKGIGRLKIGMVVYVNAIDHLELTPPGSDKQVYAYICGS